MTKFPSPSDIKFIRAFESIEDHYDWSYFLSKNYLEGSSVNALKEGGFDYPSIQSFVSQITTFSTEDLIEIALNNGTAYDAAIGALRLRNFAHEKDRALALINSPYTRNRLVGVDMIYCWLGRTFEEEIFPALYRLADCEQDEEVQVALCWTLYQSGAAEGEEHLLRLSTSPNASVRFAFASLACGYSVRAIDALVLLCRDSDAEVREAAVTSLRITLNGSSEELRALELSKDSEEADAIKVRNELRECDELAVLEKLLTIKPILIERLYDEIRSIRLEAIEALGAYHKKDQQSVDALQRELNDTYISFAVVRAAQQYGDPRLRPALLNMMNSLSSDHDDQAEIQKALLACGQTYAK